MWYLQPAGTGWSQRGPSPLSPVVTEEAVGRELISFLEQFFTLFAEYRDNEFYVVGESYGGKYGPTCAQAIDAYNSANPSQPLPLTGLVIADGWSDPQTAMPSYSDVLYNWMTIDEQQAAQIAQIMQTYDVWLT